MTLLSINVLPIRNFDDLHGQDVVMNGVQDSIAALANAIALLAGQFLRARRSWVICECLDTGNYPAPIRFGRDGCEFFPCRFVDAKAIFCHAVSSP